jgi:hypothetical protein
LEILPGGVEILTRERLVTQANVFSHIASLEHSRAHDTSASRCVERLSQQPIGIIPYMMLSVLV